VDLLFQANSFKTAEMALEIDIARLHTYRAAWLWDQRKDCFKKSFVAKLFATELAVCITGQALQIHEAQGCFMDSPIQRYFRDARMMQGY
jgi:acyl-CoA dehydrogenase